MIELDHIYKGDCMESLCDIEDASIDLTILDPFMGSGTTAVAAIKQNKHYIGFEIDDECHKVINRRISEAQLTLF